MLIVSKIAQKKGTFILSKPVHIVLICCLNRGRKPDVGGVCRGG